MASRYSVFPCPVPAPTACICRNTINVTLADCLLAFHLNGIQVGLAAGRRLLLLPTWAGCLRSQSRPVGLISWGPWWGDRNNCSDPNGKEPGPEDPERLHQETGPRPRAHLCGHGLGESCSGLWGCSSQDLGEFFVVGTNTHEWASVESHGSGCSPPTSILEGVCLAAGPADGQGQAQCRHEPVPCSLPWAELCFASWSPETKYNGGEGRETGDLGSLTCPGRRG